MKFTKQSTITGKFNTMELDVTKEQLQAYSNGSRVLIQDIFPNLSPPEREFIKTGVTPDEWNAAFGIRRY